jgi:hypothetical protein
VRRSAGAVPAAAGIRTANEAWTPWAASRRASAGAAPGVVRSTSATARRVVATCAIGRSASGRAASE